MSEEELSRAWSQDVTQQLQLDAPQHSQNDYKDTQSISLPDASADLELYQGPNAQFIPLSTSPPPVHRDRSPFTKALDVSTHDNATVNDVVYPRGQECSPSIPSWRNHLPNPSYRQETPVGSNYYPGEGLSSAQVPEGGLPEPAFSETFGDGIVWETELLLPKLNTQPLYSAQRQQRPYQPCSRAARSPPTARLRSAFNGYRLPAATSKDTFRIARTVELRRGLGGLGPIGQRRWRSCASARTIHI